MTSSPGSSPQRIVFIDVDGTILEHGVIAPSTVAAIRRARRNGHLVYLCTGRSAGDIDPRVREIGVDGEITNGGAFATRGGERLFAQPLDRADVDRLLAFFGAHGIHFFLQSDDAVFASPGIGELTEEFFRVRREQHAADLRASGSDLRAVEPVIRYRPLDEADLDAIAKAVFVSTTSDSLDVAQAELGDRFHVVPGSIPMPGGSNGEIGLLGVNKGSAILRVLDVLGLDAADAVGIGDSWNDIEMFEVVGTAVAMGGADPQLKALAGRVTTDVLDDGVRNALVELGLA
nr:Cof-type HAD-IIB family hydrolase [Microbacterium sp. No. 7]